MPRALRDEAGRINDKRVGRLMRQHGLPIIPSRAAPFIPANSHGWSPAWATKMP
ncbi:hypothetical protein [Paraburkholderia sp. FT54]|uniref:hypothetical protein n=1 Tax=Paraburkholderia sp. FT54 TaxID=3074437 RepID=UPI0038F5E7E1